MAQGTSAYNLFSSQVSFKDNGTLDAFYRLRTSSPQTIFDSKQLSDNQPLIWDDQLVSGSGGNSVYNTNQASTTLSVSNATAAVRVRQTFRRFNYQPGKSQLFLQTGIFGSASTGIKRKAGLFDSKNGLFFDQQADGMGVTIRTYTSGTAVDTRVLQANWNIDKMNGNGDSGITLDFTKSQIWFVDFEWLGVGRVRFGWVVNGIPYYCHEFNNANNLSLVYISTPNLPLRYEIENTGVGGAASFTHICSTVISEGGVQNTGLSFGESRGTTPFVTGSTNSIYPVLAMRLNSNYLGSTVKILDFSLSCTSTAAYNWYLLLNPVISGTALVYSYVTNSSVDISKTSINSTTLSGGTILRTGSAVQTNEGASNFVFDTDYALGSSIAGVSDVVILAVQRVTGTSETFYSSINWREQQ